MNAIPNQLLPVETEYRTVVFRSKSEAILARNFDLLNLLWIYEPDGFIQDDLWKPDFWVIRPVTKGPGFWSIIFEYKPSEPSETYSARLFERFKAASLTSPQSHYGVLIGSPFDVSAPRDLLEWSIEGWKLWKNTPFLRKLDEARKYRFDLR